MNDEYKKAIQSIDLEIATIKMAYQEFKTDIELTTALAILKPEASKRYYALLQAKNALNTLLK